MVIGLKSPYVDDETRTKDVAKILEKWIEDSWDDVRSGVPKGDIGFGKKQEEMQSVSKFKTLRCYTFHDVKRPYDYADNRLCYVASVNVDIWVKDNYDLSGYHPDAIKMWKYVQEFLEIHRGDHHKGMYEVSFINGSIKPQPEMRNFTNVVLLVEITYFADKVDLP